MNDERTVTWRELLAETRALLGDARHTRWICERAAGASGDEFRSMSDQPATVRQVAHLDEMVARTQCGEPIAYVIGSWEFRRVELAVDRRVLIPRPETELLAGLAIDAASRRSPTRVVADLGTGSGAIGLSLAVELPLAGTTVWMTDASRDALAVASANLAGIGRAASNVRIGHGDWFDALPADIAIDVVVANPPYVAIGSPDLDASVSSWEPADALFGGEDGLGEIRRIVTGANGRLVPGGQLFLEHGHDQGPAVAALLRADGFVDVVTHADLAGLDRITTGTLEEAA
ncbi:MAG: peptide chain release factor N(5)-glutamine methyltransferase [Actinomycetota bacterium]